LDSSVLDFDRYVALALEFETFYPQSPQKPKWVHCMWEEVNKLRPKRLPVPDMQIYEQFRKLFGYKCAIKYKVSHQVHEFYCLYDTLTLESPNWIESCCPAWPCGNVCYNVP
jgi:hypothetical protein